MEQQLCTFIKDIHMEWPPICISWMAQGDTHAESMDNRCGETRRWSALHSEQNHWVIPGCPMFSLMVFQFFLRGWNMFGCKMHLYQDSYYKYLDTLYEYPNEYPNGSAMDQGAPLTAQGWKSLKVPTPKSSASSMSWRLVSSVFSQEDLSLITTFTCWRDDSLWGFRWSLWDILTDCIQGWKRRKNWNPSRSFGTGIHCAFWSSSLSDARLVEEDSLQS